MSLFEKKSLERILAESEDSKHHLKRTLGPFNLVALGIGAIIGAGLFSLTGIAAADHAGPAVVLSFVVAAIGCAFAGMCYSEFSTMIPIAGRAYTYAYATMGELLAWIIGWDLVDHPQRHGDTILRFRINRLSHRAQQAQRLARPCF